MCDSWNLFVEFPEMEEAKYLLCSKRRQVLTGSWDSMEVLSSRHVENDGAPSSLETEYKKVLLSDSKHCRNYRLPFVAARDCLVSLRTSIENLCQKNLFPYNPQALLLQYVVLSLILLLLLFYAYNLGIEMMNYYDLLITHCYLDRTELGFY